jgi:hypothetical protein
MEAVETHKTSFPPLPQGLTILYMEKRREEQIRGGQSA